MIGYLKINYNGEVAYLIIGLDSTFFRNSRVYKLRLRRYVDKNTSTCDRIVFKKHLTYLDYKKIINVIKKDSAIRNYNFIISDEIKSYICQREMYINERAKVGLAIKEQSPQVIEKFQEYRNSIDANMARKLREKQAWDSFFMNTMRKSANFSVPGSGKTSSAYGVYSYLESKKLVDKIIMIGPKNSFNSWIDEFYNCFKEKKELKVFSIQDYSSVNEKTNAVSYDTKDKNLLLFNYESLNSIINEMKLIIDDKTLLVFDEVHKVKNVNGVRAKNALEISKDAYYIIAMTGTPIPNSYIDIKNLLHILYHDEYNDFFGFTGRQLTNPSDKDKEEINKRIQPFFCRTTKEQLGVPEANDDIIVNTKASDAENELFNILLLKYSKNKLALIIRILQLESNPRMLLKSIYENGEDFSYILDTSQDIEDIDYKDYSNEVLTLINSINKTSKFNACISKAIEIYRRGEPLIIWCIFIDSIKNLSYTLRSKRINVGVIYGDVGELERQEIIKDFKNNEIDILITNPHTLAESISLHSICHNAIYFEYSYNLVHLLQSKDRIHRLGLPKNQYTQYYFIQNEFLTRDYETYSLDKNIYERLLEKERIMLEAIDMGILEQLGNIEDDINIIFSELDL